MRASLHCSAVIVFMFYMPLAAHSPPQQKFRLRLTPILHEYRGSSSWEMSVNERRNRWSSASAKSTLILHLSQPDYILPVSDKCLSSFWFTVQLCGVHAEWGLQRNVNTQWSMHPPWTFCSWVVFSRGEPRKHSVVKFHFTLCVFIDFFWFLGKIYHSFVKSEVPSALMSWEKKKGHKQICTF